ncbi:MAG TPA: hypothetical protein VNM48_00460 [Chloroflexota bacterium]|nr:hypothetical protein [Chloroflexota bacterium]
MIAMQDFIPTKPRIPRPSESEREPSDGWPLPMNGTPDEAIKAGLKAARSLGVRSTTTDEETETGPALALWFVYHLDLWIASGALTANEAEVVDRYFRHVHPCGGSGGRVASDVKRIARCTRCDQNVAVHPERRRMVDHNLQYGNVDVAREMHRSVRWVVSMKRSAIDKMSARIYPEPSEVIA